ncbi:MAG: hypothetical protein KAT48_12495 [Bacteroidales bacterium]|nr:hypothetical protein [Bacteroidales bacterium]
MRKIDLTAIVPILAPRKGFVASVSVITGVLLNSLPVISLMISKLHMTGRSKILSGLLRKEAQGFYIIDSSMSPTMNGCARHVLSVIHPPSPTG